MFSRISEDKLTIFISHRLGSTKIADEILVLEDGTLRERGSFDSLMAANGLYLYGYFFKLVCFDYLSHAESF